MTVSDELPVTRAWFWYDHTNIINAGMSRNGAWWLPVLEKGFAKYMQTYLDLDGGWESVALRALTGMPVDRFLTDTLSHEEVYSLIAE